jgi:hypothetical protein
VAGRAMVLGAVFVVCGLSVEHRVGVLAYAQRPQDDVAGGGVCAPLIYLCKEVPPIARAFVRGSWNSALLDERAAPPVLRQRDRQDLARPGAGGGKRRGDDWAVTPSATSLAGC